MNKKKFIIVVFFLILCIMLVLSYSLYKKKMQYEIVLQSNLEVNLYEEVYLLDMIKDIKNGTLVSENALLPTSRIGEQNIVFTIKDSFKKEHTCTFTLVVIDKEAPTIYFKDSLSTTVGKEIDLLQDVYAEDNSKESIHVLVEGEYTFTKEGEYTIYYKAEDASGNSTKEKAVLKVTPIPVVEVPKKDVTPISGNSSTNTGEVTFTTSKGFKGVTKNGITYIDGVLVVNKTYSLPSSYGNGLTSETKNAFNEMQSAATLAGLNVYLSSGFRSYQTQNNLYTRYVERDGKSQADTYSARAGHSEHQSGLAFDVNQINDTFNDSSEARWLSNNCYKYGFILRYPKNKSNETGYKYESWHFRYVGEELASKLYNNGDWITLEDYFGITSMYE